MPNIKRFSGFTLIEMLVTITLVGILIAVGLPLTSAWVDNAKITETESALQNAISVAKTQALRNPNGVDSQANPVAAICRVTANGEQSMAVMLVKNTATGLQDPCGAESTKLWETKLKKGVAVTYNDASNNAQPLSYLMFNSRGALVATNCPGTCPTTPDFKVAAGHGDERVIKAL